MRFEERKLSDEVIILFNWPSIYYYNNLLPLKGEDTPNTGVDLDYEQPLLFCSPSSVKREKK